MGSHDFIDRAHMVQQLSNKVLNEKLRTMYQTQIKRPMVTQLQKNTLEQQGKQFPFLNGIKRYNNKLKTSKAPSARS